MNYSITIEGQAYQLRPFTLKDHREIIKRLGKGLISGLNLDDPDVLITFAQIATDGKLTAEQVDNGLDFDGMGQLVAFIVEQKDRITGPTDAYSKAKEADPLASSSAARR